MVMTCSCWGLRMGFPDVTAMTFQEVEEEETSILLKGHSVRRTNMRQIREAENQVYHLRSNAAYKL